MITVYGLKNCDTCRRLRRQLDDRAAAYIFVDLRDQPPTAAQAARWADALGGQALINRRSTTWRGLDAATRDAARSNDGAAALAQAHPAVIKRPIWEGDGKVGQGVDSAVAAALAKAGSAQA